MQDSELANENEAALCQIAKRSRLDDRPYEIVSCGGQGNCGWNSIRSISVALALSRKVPLLEQAKAKAAKTTKTLRSDVYTHTSSGAKPTNGWRPGP